MTSELLHLRGGAATWFATDGETIVLDLSRARYCGVNEAGTILWRWLESGATREDLIYALLSRYPIAADRVAQDVDAFIEACRERGLLESP